MASETLGRAMVGHDGGARWPPLDPPIDGSRSTRSTEISTPGVDLGGPDAYVEKWVLFTENDIVPFYLLNAVLIPTCSGLEKWFRGVGDQALTALTEKGPKHQKDPQSVFKNSKLPKKQHNVNQKGPFLEISGPRSVPPKR